MLFAFSLSSSSPVTMSFPLRMDKHPNKLTTQNTANLWRLLQGGELPCQGLKDRMPVQLNVTNPEPRDKQVAWVLPATCHPDQVWLGLQIPPLMHTWDFLWLESTCPKDIKESSHPASLSYPYLLRLPLFPTSVPRHWASGWPSNS